MESKKGRGFKFANVRERYRESRVLGPERRPPTPAGFESMDATCLDCEEEWTARRSGRGQFVASIGLVKITCPNPECGQSADVPNSEVLGR
jgi:hypothetical protein